MPHSPVYTARRSRGGHPENHSILGICPPSWGCGQPRPMPWELPAFVNDLYSSYLVKMEFWAVAVRRWLTVSDTRGLITIVYFGKVHYEPSNLVKIAAHHKYRTSCWTSKSTTIRWKATLNSSHFIIIQEFQRFFQRQLLDSMKPGDSVVTIGGLHGVVSEIDNDKRTVVLDCEGIFLEIN